MKEDIFEEDDTYFKGSEMNFQQLLRTQMYWINKAIAMGERRTLVNLIYTLESMILPYADDDYTKENAKLNGDNSKISITKKVRIHRERYRLLIALMDRKGLLLERSRVDYI